MLEKKFDIPNKYMITPNCTTDENDFINKLEFHLSRGIKLIQLRSKNMSENDYISLSKKAISTATKHEGVKIILNTKPEIAYALNADGVHLTSELLMKTEERPLSKNKLVSAACHNLEELNKAANLRIDFATLSPVLKTNTHPEAIPLGWEKFATLCKGASFPIFALGGMSFHSLETAQSHGAYGIASISWW